MTKATVDSFVPKKLREFNKREKKKKDSQGYERKQVLFQIINLFSIFYFLKISTIQLLGPDISLSETDSESSSEEDGGHQDVIRKALQDPNRVIIDIQDDRSEERKEERIRSGLSSPRGEKKKKKVDDEMIELDDYDVSKNNSFD